MFNTYYYTPDYLNYVKKRKYLNILNLILCNFKLKKLIFKLPVKRKSHPKSYKKTNFNIRYLGIIKYILKFKILLFFFYRNFFFFNLYKH